MAIELPDLDMAVRDIVARWPRAEAILAARGLDLCCGGVHPLRMAAQAHGQKPEQVLDEVLKAVKQAQP